MLKKILFIVFIVICLVYICLVFVFSPNATKDYVCSGVDIILHNEDDAEIIDTVQIYNFLRTKKINLVDSKLDALNADSLEKLMETHPLVKNAECYTNAGNKVVIEVWAERPIARVLQNNGEDYYIDSEGKKIKNTGTFVLYLPLITGNVNHEYISANLMDFINYVNSDMFWRSQIEQINVDEKGEIILVPRVGSNIIVFGDQDLYEKKLEKLKTFYIKGLNVVGWNKYRKLNVEFDGQVIGEKR